MSICKNCIHNEVCEKYVTTGGYVRECKHFMPIIRCKNCKNRGNDYYCPMCYEETVEWDDDGYMEVDYIMHDRTSDDGFCDRGEME